MYVFVLAHLQVCVWPRLTQSQWAQSIALVSPWAHRLGPCKKSVRNRFASQAMLRTICALPCHDGSLVAEPQCTSGAVSPSQQLSGAGQRERVPVAACHLHGAVSGPRQLLHNRGRRAIPQVVDPVSPASAHDAKPKSPPWCSAGRHAHSHPPWLVAGHVCPCGALCAFPKA